MKKNIMHVIAFLVIIMTDYNIIIAQNNIPWLDDFTGDVLVGSSTHNYTFTTVDDNNCKIRIEEKKTSRKGDHQGILLLS